MPGRPYPIYVYIYGIILYSTNLEMGQREAAEKTRKMFGLKTFSHTTLGRAMIRLESRIKAFEDTPESEGLSSNASNPSAQSAVIGSGPTEANHGGPLPSASSTHERRNIIIKYLTKAAKQGIQQAKKAEQDIQPTKVGQGNQLTIAAEQDIQLTGAAEQGIYLTQDVLQPPQNYTRLPYKGAFFDLCHKIVEQTYKKYRCLLL